MDSNYIITADGELYHWGIKGMRWGVRRYQAKDGSLTPAGRKRYNAETEKLKAREKTLKNQERTKAKLAKLADKKAELDARENALKNPSKAKAADDTPDNKPATKKTSDMSDKELQDKVNRLRNEDAYKDLSKKLGYDTPTTEMDVKIAELEKQKRYLELQRDIKNLTPQKVSLGKKIADKVLNEVVGPAVTESGKSLLKKYLTDSGSAAIEKMLSKEVKEAAEKVAKQGAKAANKQAKKDAKAAEKEAKQEAKAMEKQAKKAEKQAEKEAKKEAKAAEKQKNKKESETAHEAEVIDNKPSGNSNKSTSSKNSKTTIDAEWWSNVSDTNVSSMTTTSSRSSGRDYVSGYLNEPISSLPSASVAGYLPAPKERDD